MPVLRAGFNHDQIEASDGTLHKALEVLAIVAWVKFLNAFAPILGVPSRILVPRNIGNVEYRRSRTSDLRLRTLIGAVLTFVPVLGPWILANPQAYITLVGVAVAIARNFDLLDE